MKELPTDYQKFIHTSRYARWIEKEKRREKQLREKQVREKREEGEKQVRE